MFTEGVEVYLGHLCTCIDPGSAHKHSFWRRKKDRTIQVQTYRLSIGASQDILHIGVHTSRQNNDEHEAQAPAHANGAEDTQRHRLGGVARLLGHVHARVKGADGPDGRQPREHEGPALRPRRQILQLGEDEFPVVALAGAADGQCDDGGEDEDQVLSEPQVSV